jgi:glycine oxidase
MLEDLEHYYTDDLNKLHDKVGAYDWGIPPEMVTMYRYNKI